jgi:transcriptional regulator with XRE-family HTH domain
MTIGDNIRKYREEKGYTRQEFAELIDRTYNTLRCYEYGTARPSPSALMKMAIVLDISILDILKG